VERTKVARPDLARAEDMNTFASYCEQTGGLGLTGEHAQASIKSPLFLRLASLVFSTRDGYPEAPPLSTVSGFKVRWRS
jgi:hypothetical protein